MTGRNGLRAVLLLNESEQVPAWQHQALKAAIEEQGVDIVGVARCLNTPPIRPTRKTFVYYCFAYLSRGRLASTRLMSIDDLVGPEVRRSDFHAIHEGAWQRIPPQVSAEFGAADLMIKFGMTLLRAPDELPFEYGVLSYHHGDPGRYRGRPAGFYEMLRDEEVQGVIVQRLSDTLDGGEILARAYSRVVPHSYGQTLHGAHLAGTALLAKAVHALTTGRMPDRSSGLGPNYRLPGTWTVVRQTWRITRKKVARAVYGALREKRWKAGWTSSSIDPEAEVVIPSAELRPVDLPPGYVFAADPFATGDGDSFFAELLNGRTGLGEIGLWRDGRWTLDILPHPGHASYPQVVSKGGQQYLFPEIAGSSSPRLFPLSDDGSVHGDAISLQGLESERLVDATLLEAQGRWFLFGGRNSEQASSRLDLWHADHLFGPYQRHPDSPICMDPRGARMAGPIAEVGGRLYRFGQNCATNYGGSVRVHRIDVLDATAYAESVSGSLRIAERWGPHTVNVQSTGVLVDYFVERWSPLAGVRRLRAHVPSRSSGEGERPGEREPHPSSVDVLAEPGRETSQ